MKDMKCLICGKKVDQREFVPLQIAYNIPSKNLYMTTNIYCKECNKDIVEPTMIEISEKLKLHYRGR